MNNGRLNEQLFNDKLFTAYNMIKYLGNGNETPKQDRQAELMNGALWNDTNEHKELENYLSQIGFSFQKICLNYLNEFTEENNASVYKNMYETYAKYILESLLLQNDEITILNVLKPILSNGKNMGLISDTLMNEFRDSEQKLIKKLNDDKTTFLENQKMKKKKSFFSFKNK